MTTITTQLADALRVFLECYESTRDHGGGWPKYVPDNAREALAAYDAQRRGHSACSQNYIDTGSSECAQQEHTPEPWQVEPGTCTVSAEPMRFRAYREPVAYVVDTLNYAANARRIVACVNACAGIPTASLEAGDLAAALGASASVIRDLSEGYPWNELCEGTDVTLARFDRLGFVDAG